MGLLSSIFIILGFLALIESLAIFTFPKLSTGIVKLMKDKSKVKKAAAIELAVAIILILIGINF